MKDRDVLFHQMWLGLAQPYEGLVFSVPVLADAQIAPDIRAELSSVFEAQLKPGDVQRIRSLDALLRDFLGYRAPGMLVLRAELPTELSFYAAEGGQELRPSFALGRGPFASDDPFAAFDGATEPDADAKAPKPLPERFFGLVWDLTEAAADLDLDAPEDTTGTWRYPPTAKFERLLRHVGIPVGLICNGRSVRLVYAPAGETTGHLTFRVEHMRGSEGRPLLAAFDLLLHARRAYGASLDHTLDGLLAESRRRQADVTDELAKQVFEAVETLVAGFETAATRSGRGDRAAWFDGAFAADERDQFYHGVLSVVLRLVFLLYAEDNRLLPVEHETYAQHLSLFGLYERLAQDAGAHPETMHQRFGAYGQLLSLFRVVFHGAKHGSLELPARRGRLFDPNTYPFLEGGMAGGAAAVDSADRAAVQPPSVDDRTIYDVLHRLVVLDSQRLSYRALDVEQIGSVYESLIGYQVICLESPAVRVGKQRVWVQANELRAMSTMERARYLKETCGLNAGAIQAFEKRLKEVGDDPAAILDALVPQVGSRQTDIARRRSDMGRHVLQPGEERRRTGSHFTPRWLAEKVVRRTLEPLLACLGEARTVAQILELKICDPAMGSGAFLVATCRELANAIVAVWTHEGTVAQVIEEHGDTHRHAQRLVAQKCIYGVDKNPAAVELAKLSLWLVTMDRDLPFTFIDHALRHGDSLVGLDFQQIESFHWAPPAQQDTCRALLRDAIEEAVELRQQLVALPDNKDEKSQSERRRLFNFSQQAIDRVRLVADVCVGAFFAEAKDAAREKERKRRRGVVETWLAAERLTNDRSCTKSRARQAPRRRQVCPARARGPCA